MSVSISGAGSISGLDQGFNVTTGSVGVGTTNPGANLEVHSDAIPRINSVFQGSKHFGMSVGGSGGGFVLTDGHFMTVNHQPYADRGTDNNLTERLRIHSDGKFSFGTETASAAKYTFNSAGTNEVARFESTDTGAYLAIKDNNSTAINFIEGGGDALSLGVNSVERLRITTSGVGINEASPDTYLHVKTGTDSALVKLEQTATNGRVQINYLSPHGDWIQGIQGATNTGDFLIYTAQAKHLTFYTSGALRQKIQSDGKVILGGNANQSANRDLSVVAAPGNSNEAQIGLQPTNSSGSYNPEVFISAIADGAYGAHVYFKTRDTSGNRLERLRITSAGDMGLGTGSPTARLDVRRGDTDGKIAEFHQSTGYGIQIRSSESVATIRAEYNQALVFETGTTATERLRITSTGRMGLGTNDPNALLEVRDSENTTQGNAQIRISKGVGSGAAPATISRANTYLHLGGTEWGSGANGKYLIGLGYTNDEVGTGIPAYMGFTETSTGGYTKGDLIFGTRGNTTGTDNPTERFRITSSGAVNISSPSNTLAAGLLNLPNGSRVSATRGNYVTGNGGVVDMARYEMISRCITAFPNYNTAICAINGAPLYINDTRDTWDRYYNLPNYLLGTLTHDCINNSSFNITLACTMTVFMGRTSTWNAVNTSGWNLIESNTSIGPFSGNTRLYVKTLGAGTHNLDNDSAMYFFSL